MLGLEANAVVLGRYRLVRELGSGLGGVTWLARDEESAQDLALKVVREGDDPGAFTMLLEEAGKLRTMPEEHVVSYVGVHDFKRDGWAALLTEYVPGGDLWHHVKRRGPYMTRDVARLGLQIGEALHAVHQLGVLHRDLKPANVLVVPGEDLPCLRVADFGIARKLRQGELSGTRPVGTRGYAAPEQFTRGTLTWAVDVYALGGVLAFLCTGEDPQDEQPVEGPLASVIAATRNLTPKERPRLSEVMRALREVAEGRPAPTLRPASTTANWDALVEVEDEPAPLKQPEPWDKPRRRRMGAVVTLGILLAVTWVLRQVFQADEPVEPAASEQFDGAEEADVEAVNPAEDPAEDPASDPAPPADAEPVDNPRLAPDEG